MMNLKKISAALLCIVMTISMLSCFAVGVSAADHNLGYAVTIEEGNFIGGKALPSNVVIVNDDWQGKTGRVAMKLDGQVYYGWLGLNAFASLALATESTVVHSGTANVQTGGNVFYVAPGIYKAPVDVYGNNIRIYGPNAGICPNEADLKTANADRPASSGSMTKEKAAETEAVITARVQMRDHGVGTIIDGFYFTENAYIYTQQGYKHRTGIYVKNNIFCSTTDTILNFAYRTADSTGYRGDVELSENRIMNCTKVLEMYFVMDTTIRNNYIDVSSVAATCHTVEANSIGDNLLIDGNYFPKTNGLFEFIVTSNADTLLQGVTIKNNIIEDASKSANPLVDYNFLGDKTVPGTMLTITGNDFRQIATSEAPFQFHYIEHKDNYVISRHIINITDNILDLNGPLVSSDVRGVLNLQGNTYTNGFKKSQVNLGNDQIKLILYPYTDLSTGLQHGAFVEDVNGVLISEIDHEKRLVTVDVTGQNKDYLDLSQMLVVSNGCTWSLYEDETLNTRINNKIIYLDGTQTDRYVFLDTDDDGAGSVYRIHVTREPGTEANLLGVVFNTYRDIPNDGDATNHIYNFNSTENFVDHQIKVSPGATYKLYADAARTTPLEDLGSYIPYGKNYKFYVVVTSADGLKTRQYSVSYNRDACDNDPAVVAMTGDKVGDIFVRSNMGLLVYTLQNLETEVLVTLETSPKATYAIKDKDGKDLSTSAAPAALKLTDGDNVFTVAVTDGTRTKTLTLTVENGDKSADATITGVEGVSATIAAGVISFVGGGDTTNVTFATRSPYAVCDIYFNEAKTESTKMTYTATKTPDAVGGRVVETRAFSLPTALLTNRYFVVCTAEDGVTTQEYELVITKNAQVKGFSDVEDPNKWYYDPIYGAVEKGLLIGDGGTFRPGDDITRQEMAMVMVRLIGANPANYSKETLPYTDAASISAWALDAVKTCHALGIFTGSDEWSSLNFNPKKAITRQDAMVLFARALELSGTADLSRFADGDRVTEYAKAGVQAAVAAGLVQGNTQGELRPKDTINRAEMAAICSRVTF